MSAKLGEILVRENLISPQHLREALDYQREHGGRLGLNLVKLGLVSDDMITAVLSRQYGIPSVNLDLFNIDPSVISLIPQEVAQKHSVLPLSRVGATLTLAMVDPTNVFAMDDVKFMTGLNVEPVVVAEGSVQQAIAKYYGSSREIELASTQIEEVTPVHTAKGNGSGEPGYVIKDEIWEGAKHDKAGLLCMANRGPNTNGAQFFITDAAAAHLDKGYTIFGECAPVEVVQDIASVPVMGERPANPITIKSVTISRDEKKK